jgi:hypothetical protein
MLSSLEQKVVWQGLLGSEIRANYFADLASRYLRRQRIITWAILLSSSGAFFSLVTDVLPSSLHWIRPVSAFITAALSFWSLTSKNERSAIDCSDLHFKFNLLSQKCERLWDDMYSETAAESVRTLQEEGAELSRTSINFPVRKRLMLKWQNHVELHHGIRRPD